MVLQIFFLIQELLPGNMEFLVQGRILCEDLFENIECSKTFWVTGISEWQVEIERVVVVVYTSAMNIESLFNWIRIA